VQQVPVEALDYETALPESRLELFIDKLPGFVITPIPVDCRSS
jgi:hypothetical protein